ncbi:hypothetical protein QOZ80_1BG0079200 [Eleusine coracana subsp. coracana]|nr:hypothetical protein QOZ80_1BG0079200 [Eleusine coracana subsp. coracana]
MASPPSAHVLLVSAPLQGHVNPLLVLGRRLASRGLLVTFSTVPLAGLKLTHDNDTSPPRGPPAALAALLRRQSTTPVTCVVVNAFAPWALRVARDLGLPHAVLWTESCAVLSLYYHHFHFHSLADDFPAAAEAGPTAAVAVVPGLPPLVSSDLPGLIHAPEEFIWRRTLLADLRCLREGTALRVLVNTFDELERDTVKALRAHLPTVVPVGPLFDTEPEVCDDGHEDECAAWLDAQPPGSVVFVAFGSILKISRDEVAELAAGLAATGRPFLWVVRDDNRDLLLDDDDNHDCLAPVITGSKGKVVAWCEQGRVLAHAAVGCFVTHCGWNSTIEALAAGVPVVAYPGWADQPTNAKFLTDVYGVGVRLPRPMAREALRRCVEEVVSGPGAAAMRERAGRWKAQASAALSDDGSSEKGTQDFVDAVLSTGAAGDGH